MTLSRCSAIALSAVLALAPVAGGVAFAQGFSSQDTGLEDAAKTAGYDVQTVSTCKGQPGGCIPVVIGNVISALLGLFGALFLVLIMWGGVQYMFAQGDATKVKAATQTIQNAIVGMLIVAASYAIVTFVLQTIGTATSGGGSVGQQPPGAL